MTEKIVFYAERVEYLNIIQVSFSFLRLVIHRGARGWLRHCATSRKVAGSIPDGVIGIFH